MDGIDNNGEVLFSSCYCYCIWVFHWVMTRLLYHILK